MFLKDFGVWNVSYEAVSCLENWEGAKERAALGSVDDGSSVCCPAEPTVSCSNTRSRLKYMNHSQQGSANDTCPSYSDQNGLP